MLKRIVYEIRCSLVVELCHVIVWVCPKRGEFCYVVVTSIHTMMAGLGAVNAGSRFKEMPPTPEPPR